MEKIVLFASDQWLLITALAAALWGLVFLENKRAGVSVSPAMLTKMVNGGDAVVIDLREKAEFEKGHIVDAKSIPYKTIHAELAKAVGDSDSSNPLENYRDKEIVLVCKMGQHSSQIAKKLAADNYKVYRLGGGLMEWQSAQMPLVKS